MMDVMMAVHLLGFVGRPAEPSSLKVVACLAAFHDNLKKGLRGQAVG